MIDQQRRRLSLGASLALASLCLPLAARAQAWPARAVNFIVPFPPGGPVDTAARFTTLPLGERWSQPAVVDNRSGAGGIVGAQFAAKAPADGYHFFFAAIHHAVLPSLHDTLSYDILEDFEPVGMTAVFPIVLVVHPDLPVHSVQELVEYARARPGALSFSSSGTGGGTHLAGEQVQMMFADGPSAVPHLSTGRVRALGVGTPQRSAMFPDQPTIAESGLPGYEAYSWSGLLAPKGTPPALIARVNADMVQVLSDPAIARKLLAAGAQAQPGSPQAFRAFLQAEIEKWREVIRSAGITLS
ncbi:MFS transporter [Bordetella trematum]|uniref:Bug family tripartite tricarboxylate transporter substrate binding protein n=1 Tax=Bordetella trematum TaxID=123899 RepID=UPI000CA10DFB|nr:tripartite tricarboxylate transporter substrate-binding protein [Bordetella trematum]AUL49295.1 MFS transporter [Bordetella trematum]